MYNLRLPVHNTTPVENLASGVNMARTRAGERLKLIFRHNQTDMQWPQPSDVSLCTRGTIALYAAACMMAGKKFARCYMLAVSA